MMGNRPLRREDAAALTKCSCVLLVGQKLKGTERKEGDSCLRVTFYGQCKHVIGSRAGRLSGEVRAHVMGLVERCKVSLGCASWTLTFDFCVMFFRPS